MKKRMTVSEVMPPKQKITLKKLKINYDIENIKP